jgi:hypothetical protein
VNVLKVEHVLESTIDHIWRQRVLCFHLSAFLPKPEDLANKAASNEPVKLPFGSINGLDTILTSFPAGYDISAPFLRGY